MMLGEFEFNHPEAWAWLWLVAVAGVVATLALRSRRGRLRRFADDALLRRIAPTFTTTRPIARSVLAVAAMAAVVTALVDPRWGFRYEEVQRRGLDCFFVVDVSRSMLAEDASPNRLGRAKSFIEDALRALPGDRVGLIAYAGTASIRCPLTLNEDLFRMSLDELAPESTVRGGSLLGDAIRTAAESFTDDQPGAKVVVVLTDGEDQGSFPVEAASKAYADLGVRVFTVGVVDSGDGARIPVGEGSDRRWLMHEGREVWTKMDDSTLREVALAGDGAYFPAGTRLLDMAEALDLSLGSLERAEQESTTIRRSTPRFQWFAGLALLLLVVETFISDRRGGWLAAWRNRRGVAMAGGDRSTSARPDGRSPAETQRGSIGSRAA
ncbi:MAG: VWA domain-containing protein [Phycisphaerales bacterium]